MVHRQENLHLARRGLCFVEVFAGSARMSLEFAKRGFRAFPWNICYDAGAEWDVTRDEGFATALCQS